MSSDVSDTDLEIGVDPDSTPRERLEASLKTPYPVDGPVWSALLAALEAEFKELERVRKEIAASRFVDTAGAAELERLATVFDLERRTDDTLPEFRARVKTALRSQITSGTLQEIGEVIVVLLDISRDEVQLVEPDDEIAQLEPRIPADTMGQSDVRPSVLNDILDDVSAAGVNAEANFLAETARLRLVGWSTERMQPTEAEPAALSFDVPPSGARTLSSVGLSASEMEPLSSSGWQLSADDLGFWSSGSATPGLIPGPTVVRPMTTTGPASLRLVADETSLATNRESSEASPNLIVEETDHRTLSTVGLSASTLDPLSTGDTWTLSNADA